MKSNQQATKGGDPWSAEEKVRIEDAVRNEIEFTEICALFPTRTPGALRHRVRQVRLSIHGANAPAIPQPAPTVVSKTPQARSTVKTGNAQASSQTAQAVAPQAPGGYAKAGQIWTAEDIQDVNTAVGEGLPFDHIRALFPDRSETAIKHRYLQITKEASSTVAKKPKSKYHNTAWTAEDDQKVRDAVRANLSRDDIRAMFPNRSTGAVRIKISRITKDLQDQAQEPASLPVGHLQGPNDGAGSYDDTDMDLYADPSEPEDIGQADQRQLEVPEAYPVRSSSLANMDLDHVIGPIPEDEEFVMSGALPVSQPAASEDEVRVRGSSRSSHSPRSVHPWKVQAVEDSIYSSTPHQREVEAPAPPPRAQENPAIGNQQPTCDYFPFEPSFETTHGTVFSNPFESPWFQTQDNGWDLDSGLDPETRAWLNAETHSPPNDVPDDPYVSNLAQARRPHPVLPQGSLGHTDFPTSVVPCTYYTDATQVDNGYSRYQLSADDHPDLRDGLDFTPVPHHPHTPAGFFTSEQMFADPSVLPSAVMASPPDHDSRWMAHDEDEDMVMEEDT
ncbi:hypothetical protein PMIN06_011937 [Paraphaeosphaeria minitans]